MSQYLGLDGRILPHMAFGDQHYVAGVLHDVAGLLCAGLDNFICGCHWYINWEHPSKSRLPTTYSLTRIVYCTTHKDDSEAIQPQIAECKEQLNYSLRLARCLQEQNTLNQLGKHLFCEWRRQHPLDHRWVLRHCPDLPGEAVLPNIHTTRDIATTCWNRYLLDASAIANGAINYHSTKRALR
ncbi:MAG: hypothetical protein U0894_08695 [Pirellulales bacterium]